MITFEIRAADEEHSGPAQRRGQGKMSGDLGHERFDGSGLADQALVENIPEIERSLFGRSGRCGHGNGLQG